MLLAHYRTATETGH